MIIVLSTGRTGTHLLGSLLKNVGVDLEIRHQKPGSRILNIWGNVSIMIPRVSRPLNKFLSKVVLSRDEKTIVIDPLLSTFLYNIYSIHDDSEVNIIHLIRDPRNFVTSFMNWKSSTLKRTLLHHFIPLWQPSPWLVGDISLIERLQLSKFEHFCWIWAYKNRLFRDYFSNNKNYKLIKFEEIIDPYKGIESLESLFVFINLPKQINKDAISDLKQKFNRSLTNKFPKWQKWSPEKARILDYWCGDLMRELGYGNEPEWHKLINSEFNL